MDKPDNRNGRQTERRGYSRIKKNYILTYFKKDDPNDIYEITQLKNISLGGMCFVTTKKIAPGTFVGINLQTPYISEVTNVNGKILESHEKAKNIVYETRLQFEELKPEAEFVLKTLINYFLDGEKEKNE
ncbi:MAG: PilZ domain-containing protein [Candidatus Omnitrophica bacterium]|nr:PilZ domain-containing protein [Candidatus Omnitrophota bacterium]